MATKKKDDAENAVADDSTCVIKGTKGSKHLVTDKEYENVPGKNANVLIANGHATLVSEEKKKPAETTKGKRL